MTDIIEGSVSKSPAAEAAFAVDQQIRATLRQMKGLWVHLAEQLYRFHTAEMWRDLGHDTFEAYLADPELELDLQRRWVFELIGMYRTLVVEREVSTAELEGLHVSKVREVLPAIRRGWVDIPTALSDVETLTRHDMELKYRGLASSTPGRPDMGTQVDTDAEPEWRECPTCGSTYLVRSDG
jgi:hypothetical protein